MKIEILLTEPLGAKRGVRPTLPGYLIASIFYYIRLRPECGLVQPVDYIHAVEPVLAGPGFDIAVIAGGPESHLLECLYSGRILLLYIANDHFAADESVEPKHGGDPPRGEYASRIPNGSAVF